MIGCFAYCVKKIGHLIVISYSWAINTLLPALKSRERETKQMDFLFAMNKRYPHAWYARRFFNKVNVSEVHGPHFGMGLDCYVQWSSPIRRITDVQVSTRCCLG